MIRHRWLSILFLFLWRHLPVYAVPPESTIHQTYDSFINAIQLELIGSRATSRKGVVSSFCHTVLAHRYLAIDEHTGMTPVHYDARQSLFLLALCSHVWVDLSFFSRDLLNHYTKTLDLTKLDIICKKEWSRPRPHWCVPGCSRTWGSLNTCNFALLTNKIFTLIQNDLSNIGLAHAYGHVISLNDWAKKEEERANELYFKRSNSVLKNEKFPHFPRTHRYLTTYLKNTRDLMKKTVMIDGQTLQTRGSKKKETDCLMTTLLTDAGQLDQKKNRDIRWCMYSPSQAFAQTDGDMWLFINTMYNELIRYRLFAVWYGKLLRHDLTLSRTDKSDAARRQIEQIAFESWQARRDADQAALLMQSVIKTINQVRYTFPVHIWLLAYHESILWFRSVMAKLFTPIHQLWYKITNAQAQMY